MNEAVAAMARTAGLSPDDLEMLRTIPIFQGFADTQWLKLLPIMRVRSYSRNQIIYSQGDVADYIYIVLQGWMRIFRSLPDGNEVTVNLFTTGESLAEAAIFAGDTYPVSGGTVEDSRLLLVSATGLRSLLGNDPKLALNMLASMSQKLHFLVRQLEQVSNRTARQRVAAFLLTLAEKQKTSTIRLPIDKHLIAGRLGMQPETFSRALTKLRADGVSTRGGMVHLADINRIRHVVNA
ncbi:MAG: Crp/Fnr family transcriptional regulator [Geminicoccaceae bacterium]|nr:Crp/Fnr family transcriptional regulator [Geminicoccaceae bacterium]MCB9945848.1 Crp/Fnr family transcriptional regulator [Geminicoccaceae bacterium]